MRRGHPGLGKELLFRVGAGRSLAFSGWVGAGRSGTAAQGAPRGSCRGRGACLAPLSRSAGPFSSHPGSCSLGRLILRGQSRCGGGTRAWAGTWLSGRWGWRGVGFSGRVGAGRSGTAAQGAPRGSCRGRGACLAPFEPQRRTFRLPPWIMLPRPFDPARPKPVGRGTRAWARSCFSGWVQEGRWLFPAGWEPEGPALRRKGRRGDLAEAEVLASPLLRWDEKATLPSAVP